MSKPCPYCGWAGVHHDMRCSRPPTCPTCNHDAPHDPEDGCQFVYSSTSKGQGIGGQALTACGCKEAT